MRVLITGSNGFIGKRFAQFLNQRGYSVVCTGRQEKPSDLPGEYVRVDLRNREDCERAVKNCEAVIHCAGKAGAWGDYESYYQANVLATENLLSASRKASIQRFLNISSPSIYFDYKHQFDLKEDQRPRHFSNAYASTKYEAEKKVEAAHDPSFWTISFRPRGVIGAGDRNWLPRIIEMRKAGKLFQIGDGKNLGDFTSVSNLCRAMEQVLEADFNVYGRVYNITNGTPQPLWKMIEDSLRAVGLDGKRKKLPLPLMMGVAKASERIFGALRSKKEPTLLPIKVGVAAYSMTLNIEAARKAFPYQPQESTSQAIEEFSLWWSSITSKE